MISIKLIIKSLRETDKITMGILKIVRRNKFINSFFRKTLKTSSKLSVDIHTFFINRWTPSGVLDCNFGQYKFKYYNKCDEGLPYFFYYNLPFNKKTSLNLFIELAKRSLTIVDIGANTGLF